MSVFDSIRAMYRVAQDVLVELKGINASLASIADSQKKLADAALDHSVVGIAIEPGVPTTH